MENKTICPKQAALDLLELYEEEKAMRKPKRRKTSPLEKHLAEVLAWASAKYGSKQRVANLCNRRLNLNKEVSADQVYYFVRQNNGGVWPHARTQKGDQS